MSIVALGVFSAALFSGIDHELKPSDTWPTYAESGKSFGANPARLYPPSCLSHPLPTQPFGPGTLGPIELFSTDRIVTGRVEMWRIACANDRSALLYKLSFTPLFPGHQAEGRGLLLTQNGVQFIARVAIEPGTKFTQDPLSIINSERVWVVEGATPINSMISFDLNQPFDTEFPSNGTLSASRGSFGAYNKALYPDTALSMRLTGHLSGTWFNPARPGEGIFFEVGELGAESVIIFYSWFTYDSQGIPFWIIGNTTAGKEARSVTVPTLILSNGGFAGAFQQTSSQSWGSVSFSFPNCGTMKIEYASNHNIQGIPAGSGTLNWSRLTSINSLTCD